MGISPALMFDYQPKMLAGVISPTHAEEALGTPSPSISPWFLLGRRKWLPPPLRKLSQGKVEKGIPSTAPDRPTLKKTGSDKRFKDDTSVQYSRDRLRHERKCGHLHKTPARLATWSQ
uniref:Uncharacterized protein n=1 Tax=Timema cristinae TaxID=61476 RepID=A0A7R9CFV3_TIMCR|nr:unnamed protein product [Timema cristinae]